MAYYNYTQNPYLYTGNPYTYTDNPYPYPHAYPVPSSSAPSYPYPPVIPTTRYDYHRSCVRARPSARLPVELYRQIIQHLRDYRSDLMTLMVTSRTIRMEAEQVLYGYVALADPRAQRLFCRQILAHPRLALLVRRYHFSTEHQSKHIGMVERDATEQGVQLLSRVLPMFTGLKDLKFSFQPEGEGCPAYILDNCTFELESFEWDSDCCTEKLVPFLRKRQLYGLRHLDLITWPSGLSPSGLWPNLMSLGGGDDTIAAVLPRGRISQLRWHSTVSPEELKQKICPDRLLHNVRILSFSHDLTLKEQRTVFRFLGTLFPNLQILEDVRYCTLGVSTVQVHQYFRSEFQIRNLPFT